MKLNHDATVAVDEQGRLAADQSCIGCGYNLRTLTTAANCPECGQPVETTLRRVAGNIAFTAEWLRSTRFHVGVLYMLAAQACFIVGLVMFCAMTWWGPIMVVLLFVAIATVFLTTPGPPTPKYGWSRRWQVVTLGLMTVGILIQIAMMLMEHGVVSTIDRHGARALRIGWAVTFFGGLTMLLVHGAMVGRLFQAPVLQWGSLLTALMLMITVGLMIRIEVDPRGGWRYFRPTAALELLRVLAVTTWFAATALLVALALTFRRVLARPGPPRRREGVGSD